jgi:hypothetical protein
LIGTAHENSNFDKVVLGAFLLVGISNNAARAETIAANQDLPDLAGTVKYIEGKLQLDDPDVVFKLISNAQDYYCVSTNRKSIGPWLQVGILYMQYNTHDGILFHPRLMDPASIVKDSRNVSFNCAHGSCALVCAGEVSTKYWKIDGEESSIVMRLNADDVEAVERALKHLFNLVGARPVTDPFKK